MACEICQRPTHEWYSCPKKPDGYVPLARRQQKESTAALKEVQRQDVNTDPPTVATKASDTSKLAGGKGPRPPKAETSEVRSLGQAGTQALPVDTKPRGRPILDAPTSKRAAYMRDKMRQLRRDHPEKYGTKRRLKLYASNSQAEKP